VPRPTKSIFQPNPAVNPIFSDNGFYTLIESECGTGDGSAGSVRSSGEQRNFENSYRMNFIGIDKLLEIGRLLAKSGYGRYLIDTAEQKSLV
jgi:hypothetical protein